MSKLWQKNISVNERIEAYTVGNDAMFDMHLAPFDVLGSIAHVTMLGEVGLLEKDEVPVLIKGLQQIYSEIQEDKFEIQDHVEDVHSQVELLLTERLGDVGKKIHSGRSRNDQVLVDLKLFLRSEIIEILEEVKGLFNTLLDLSEKHKDTLLPGYTHLQIAMPSSFGLWFAAYAESLNDDVESLLAAFNVANKNPLGSAAGYGSSFPLNREMTTDLLGFSEMNTNVVYAQMTRGKTEKLVAQAIANIASTLSKMSMDVCLYMNQNFGFITFPEELTTGSSIMPHKKNPDVFEIMRGKCNLLQGAPNDLALLLTNLPSGYHRELQLTKEILFPGIESIKESLSMASFMLQNIEVKEGILEDDKYKFIFSVEEVNKLVLQGVPFRDAYKQVGLSIAEGSYAPEKNVAHTHEGSVGNLKNNYIRTSFEATLPNFGYEEILSKLNNLLT